MTTQATKREFVVGYLDAIGVKGNKTTYSMKKNPDRQYPDWYVGFFANDDQEPAPRLTTGAWYKMLCDVKEGGVSAKSGRPIVYHNLVQATPIAEAEARKLQAGAPQHAPSPAPRPMRADELPFDDRQGPDDMGALEAPGTPVHGSSTYSWSLTPAKPEPGPDWDAIRNEKNESIWRSVALQQAVAHIGGAQDHYAVTEVYEVYLAALRSGQRQERPNA